MFHDFSGRELAGARPTVQISPVGEATELIARYPNLGEIELTRLINLYRSLSALEMALIISDEELGPKLDRFSVDQRSRIRTPFRQYAVLIGIAVVGIIIALWAVASAS